MTKPQPAPKKVGALPAGPPIIMPIARETPRRAGCLRILLLGALVPLVLFASGWVLIYVSLLPARSECARIAPGTHVDDAEDALDRELGASRTGSGGPTGGPLSEVDVGDRGTLVSWQCELSLDATGHVTSTRFVPWITPALPGPVDRTLDAMLPR